MRRVLLVLLSSAVLFACPSAKKDPTPTERGTSTGTKVTQTIGPSGGSITSGDGLLKLEFPMGALSADTEIGIEPVTNFAPAGRGPAYRLTPDGSKFTKPAKLTFKYTADTVNGSSKEALRVAYQGNDGFWHTWTQNTRDDTALTVTQETTHFTDVSMVLGWQLVPFEAKVAPLEVLDLKLKYCEPETVGGGEGDELSGLTPRCDLDEGELPHFTNVKEWAVNGKSGGSLGDGTIAGTGVAGKYTAPGKEPLSNPVAVSVSFGGLHGETNLAVANVSIGAKGWSGSVTWTFTGNKSTTEGDYVRTWKAMGNGRINVKPGTNTLPEVETATNTYNYSYEERVTQMYTQGACMHNVVQTTTETLTGTSMTGASVVITTEGANSTIAIGVPAGMTTGNVVVEATDTVTGSGCTSPQPTRTDNPSTGTIPSDSLIVTVAAGNPDRLQGQKAVTVAGSPPREFNVSYDLTK